MRRLTAPTISATLSTGLVLDVKSASITLDESSAPYVSAVLLCAAPSGDLVATIDPRNRLRVTVRLDDRASLFGGVSSTRTFDLALFSRQAGAAGGELSLQLFSDETTLIDRGLLLANVKDWGASSARVLVGKVLTSLGYTLAPSAALDVMIDPAAAVQSPGQTYWDFLDGTVQGANLRLWCDEARIWHLDTKGAIAPGQLSLEYDGTVTGLNDAIGLDESFADAVVVRYSYETPAGNSETSYEVAGNVSSQRVTVIPFSGRPAVAGAARRLLARLQGRGRVLSTEAVSRFDVVPTQSFLATLPDGAPVQGGIVSAVTWDIPDDRMTVRSRDLNDTTSTAWAARPQGVSWSSIPAGVSWSEYLAIAWDSVPVGTTWNDVTGYRWNEYEV